MKFGDLNYLWLIIVIPCLAAFYVIAAKARHRAMERFASEGLWKELVDSRSPGKVHFKRLLILAGMFFLVIALVQPQWGYHWEEVKRKGIDIMVALDVSKSMLSEDIQPSRLERAKKEVENFINRLTGDRIGMVSFAGGAFIQCPLTLDYSTAKLFLNDIEVGTIPLGGTDIGGAIKKSIEAFGGEEKKRRVLILITDGEDNSGQVTEALEEAKQKGIIIYPVGIGLAEGSPIPIRYEHGNRTYVKDNSGRVVISKPDYGMLDKIAYLTGGKRGGIGGGQFPLDEIYAREIGSLGKEEMGHSRQKRFHDRFQWPLGIAIILLGAEAMIGERKWRNKTS